MLVYCLMLLDDPDDAPLMREMYELYHEKLLKYALGLLNSPHDAEDAVQAAWERVARHFPTAKKYFLKSRSVFLSWFVIIVKNLAIDEQRRRNRMTEFPVNWEQTDHETTETRSEARALWCAIRSMPAKYRTVMELRLINECSFPELGKVTGLSEDAARMRYNRGLDILQKTLWEEGVIHGKDRI